MGMFWVGDGCILRAPVGISEGCSTFIIGDPAEKVAKSRGRVLGGKCDTKIGCALEVAEDIFGGIKVTRCWGIVVLGE